LGGRGKALKSSVEEYQAANKKAAPGANKKNDEDYLLFILQGGKV
jgi:hypothetical protein